MFSSFLYNLEQSAMTEIVLGKVPDIVITDKEQRDLLILSAKTWQILAYERELPFY